MRAEFILNIVPNKSKTYILPFISSQFDFDMYPGIINTYASFEKEDDIFCVMYKWSAQPNFKKFEGMVMSHHLYVGHKDYNEHTIYKFRLSRNMQQGKKLFMEGKYKDFSDEHKMSIINYLDKIKASNKEKIKLILQKESSIVSSAPELKNEIATENIKEIEIKVETFKD